MIEFMKLLERYGIVLSDQEKECILDSYPGNDDG